MDNAGGDGIRAGDKTLISCIAERNAGVGLKGGELINCGSFDNGGDGMNGASAVGCLAELNRGAGISVEDTVTSSVVRFNQTHGILAGGEISGCLAQENEGWGALSGQSGGVITIFSGNVSDTLSILNTRGIGGIDLDDCVATFNAEIGILGGGTATGCLAENNGGPGFGGLTLTDCTMVHNGQGLNLAGTARRCTVAENLGVGVNGGGIDACTVHHNAGLGVNAPDWIDNTWVLGNEGIGVAGRAGPSYTTITDSAIRDNTGPGVTSSWRMSGSIIHGNDAANGYDYLEQRLSDELLYVDLSGNYWGPETTALMNDHPWGTYYDIPAIYDFVNDTRLTEAKYGDHLTSSTGAGPGDEPPAFLLSLLMGLLGPGDPLNVGINPFLLTFSKPMNTETAGPLSVTFGLEPPYAGHVIEPAPGWIDPYTWRGRFSIQSDTGDGVNVLRVAGALDAGGRAVPTDTAHRFVIDTAGGLAANNGLAIGQGTSMVLSWPEAGGAAGALGFNVHRSPTGAPATFEKINDLIITGIQHTDTSLSQDTVYWYIVYLVDADNNATQWTPPFFGRTEERTWVGEWMVYE